MFRARNLILFVSDDECEEKIELLRQRRILRDKSDPLSLPSKNFVQRFRLSKEAFLLVLETINLESGCRSTHIPPILRLCATLEVLGGGGYQWLTGNDYGISVAQSTLSGIVSDTTKVLEEKLCPIWIKWELGRESKREEIKQWFYRKYSIPGIIGCIDGTHLFFQRPRENEQLFFNRKGKHSLNAMIICDHEMRITSINPRYAGSAHDSLVWRHSNERIFFENSFNERQHNYWLLGDSGYPLEPWLLTPYRTSTDTKKTKYNSVHAKARNIIERCIGLYKGRWRILLEERKSRYDPKKIAVFANVCAALHNICIHYNVALNESISTEESLSETFDASNNQVRHFANRIRDEIKESLSA